MVNGVNWCDNLFYEARMSATAVENHIFYILLHKNNVPISLSSNKS